MATASREGALVRTLYRAFLREARRIERRGAPLRLCSPLTVETIAKSYGRGAYLPAGSPLAGAALQASLFGPETQAAFLEAGVAGREELAGSEVLAVVRRAFRSPPQQQPGAAAAASSGIDAALRSLQALNRQRALQRTHSSTTTAAPLAGKGGGIVTGAEVRVEVATTPIQSLPSRLQDEVRVYPFAYRVRVTNSGSRVVQLLSRHWRFEDTLGGVIEVPKGSPGVVGHTPHLDVGQTFEYVSGTQLRTQSGTMRGSFGMVVPGTGERFEALVGTTGLAWGEEEGVEVEVEVGEGRATSRGGGRAAPA